MMRIVLADGDGIVTRGPIKFQVQQSSQTYKMLVIFSDRAGKIHFIDLEEVMEIQDA